MAFSPFPACKKPLDSFAKLRLYLLYAKDRALAHCKYGSDFFRPNNHHALQGKAGTAFTKDGARAEFVFLLFGKLDGRPTTVGENRSFLLCSGPELPMDMQRDFERQLETLARPMLCDYNCLGQTDSVFGCTNLNLETGAFGTHIEIHTNCEGEDPCFVYTGFGDRETSWRSSTAKELPLAGGDWVLVEASLHLHDDPHRVPRKSYDVVAHRIRALNIQPSLNIPPELRATEALEGEMEVKVEQMCSLHKIERAPDILALAFDKQPKKSRDNM
ncbi:hypothetical protein R3P38DRAFT_2810160 [Favolaschia claudopus]|uniref:Uncharacterized protein n=1 Tax=Favolaschia claudopus TaxID=2862362 RepID=A0AAV9ZCN3_9AGAR